MQWAWKDRVSQDQLVCDQLDKQEEERQLHEELANRRSQRGAQGADDQGVRHREEAHPPLQEGEGDQLNDHHTLPNGSVDCSRVTSLSDPVYMLHRGIFSAACHC
jgi:hypothetical protein